MNRFKRFIILPIAGIAFLTLLISMFNIINSRDTYSFLSSQNIKNNFNSISQKSSFNIREDKKSKNIYYTNTVCNQTQKNLDGYGSYDIYMDKNNTEYWFIHNTNIFCGLRNTVKTYHLNKEPSSQISYTTAIDISKTFCKTHVYNFSDYVYDSYFYDPDISSYCISFYKPIDNCRTDDIINICISNTGDIQAFSAYNCGRYDNLSFDTTILNQLTFPDKSTLATSLKCDNFDVTSSYISRDNYGDLNIVYIIKSDTRMDSISYPITLYQ